MIFSLEYIKQITNPDFLLRNHVDDVLKQIERMGLRYEYEERAGILQFDGGLSRDAAEKQALEEIRTRIKNL
ncbi:MAG: hypothetical protein ABSB11_04675 [Sedimentisphaerales bacterium]|jgi:hypothetical protein